MVSQFMDKVYFEWLKAANDDLKLIEKIQNEADLTHLIAFHSQQAVEKSLKALFEYKNQEVPKIHSLNKLFDLYREITVDEQNMIITLDSLYIESRYPGDLGLLPYGKPTIKDSTLFYEFAKNIYLEIGKIVHEDKFCHQH